VVSVVFFWVLVNDPNIFSEDVRDHGASLSNGLQWGFNLAVSSLSPLLFASIGVDKTFYIFGGFGVLCTIYLFIQLPRDKEIEHRVQQE